MLLPLLAALGLLVAACGEETAESGPGADAPPEERAEGAALGGGARTETLATATDVQVPEGEVAWITRSVTLQPGEELRHEHAFSTVYAHAGPHALTTVDGRTTLAQGEGASVPADTEHVHTTTGDEPSVFWETFLGEPGAELPGVETSELVSESEPLEGIPQDPAMQFILVELPPGTKTSVHTHPGPEFIFGLSGDFTYENAIEGQRPFGPGDEAAIPPDTAVQKRNRTQQDASFLSWFLVDPEQPFAPAAAFGG